MKKKATLLTASIFCVLGVVTGAFASSIIKDIKAQLRPDFTIVIDGKKADFKNAQGEAVYPVLYDGTTYLPVRAIGEMMDKTVYWYEDEKRIEFKATTVTDADVIVGSTDKKNEDKPVGQTKPVGKTEKLIGEDAAKKIALKKAGITEDGVIFEKVELDRDDGVLHYDVEFKKGVTEYEAEISAADGKIISWEKDYLD